MTKQLKLYETVHCKDYNIICLTETWLDDLCYDHNLFSDCYTVFRSDRLSVNKTWRWSTHYPILQSSLLVSRLEFPL
jgi:hypothetical protein